MFLCLLFSYLGKKKGCVWGPMDMESGNCCRHHKKGAGKNSSSHSSLKSAIHTPYTRLRWQWDKSCSRKCLFVFTDLKGSLGNWKKKTHPQSDASTWTLPKPLLFAQSTIRALITCYCCWHLCWIKISVCMDWVFPPVSFPEASVLFH